MCLLTLNDRFMTPKNLIKTVAIVATSMFVLCSCNLRQAFVRPAVKTDSLYRGVINPDTASIASISWMEMFKDRNLQALIREGINNNCDLKIAVARMKQAEANLLQSKAAFLPALSVEPQYTRQK